MLAVGILVSVVGYGLGFWGYQVYNGCSASFIDVMWPGRFQPCGGATAPVSQYNAANPGTQSNGLPSGTKVVTQPGGGTSLANAAPPGAGQS